MSSLWKTSIKLETCSWIGFRLSRPLYCNDDWLLDDFVAVELSDSIQEKALAMTIGLQLAYCYLRPRSAIEDRRLDELLQELKPIMMAGV